MNVTEVIRRMDWSRMSDRWRRNWRKRDINNSGSWAGCDVVPLGVVRNVVVGVKRVAGQKEVARRWSQVF